MASRNNPALGCGQPKCSSVIACPGHFLVRAFSEGTPRAMPGAFPHTTPEARKRQAILSSGRAPEQLA